MEGQRTLYRTVGKTLGRVEGAAKVSGQATYTATLHRVLQEEHGPAPFQGKAVGESSMTPLTAAIANAVYDAVGVRLRSLPITAEKV
jgi:hypothetical protein